MTSETPQKEEKKTSLMGEILSIFYILLTVFVVRLVVFDPFFIPSSSMYPTLKIGDMPIVRKWEYGYSKYAVPFIPVNLPIRGRILFDESDVKQGDVVVFRYPQDTSINYIKRVIGLPGDTVQMRHGRLYINGKVLNREYVGDYTYLDRDNMPRTGKEYLETLPNGVVHRILEIQGDIGQGDNTRLFTVPQGHYFMMGDNRDASLDSRFLPVGYVPAVNFVGPANRLMWSYDSVAGGNWAILKVWRWPFNIRYGRLFIDFTKDLTE